MMRLAVGGVGLRRLAVVHHGLGQAIVQVSQQRDDVGDVLTGPSLEHRRRGRRELQLLDERRQWTARVLGVALGGLALWVAWGALPCFSSFAAARGVSAGW